jgi:hypothetical protein
MKAISIRNVYTPSAKKIMEEQNLRGCHDGTNSPVQVDDRHQRSMS